MSKAPCPTCDRPIDPHRPCRDCATLALFGGLPRPDRYGKAYYLHPLDLDDYEPEAKPLRPRFLCLSEPYENSPHEILFEEDVDMNGTPVIGRDRYHVWFGTLDAPCIVPGGDVETIIRLNGRCLWDDQDWTGLYIGSEQGALRAVPPDVAVDRDLTEQITVERRWL